MLLLLSIEAERGIHNIQTKNSFDTKELKSYNLYNNRILKIYAEYTTFFSFKP